MTREQLEVMRGKGWGLFAGIDLHEAVRTCESLGDSYGADWWRAMMREQNEFLDREIAKLETNPDVVIP